MPWPLSQDYNEAIQDMTSSFGDADLKRGEAATNALGIPMPRSGNFADVYEVTTPGGKWAVKCFTRQIPGLRERYKEVSAYLKKTPLPFMVDFSYLEQGIRVRGDWYPVLKMQWVEGFNLNQFVKDNADKPHVLEVLCQLWVKLAARLTVAEMAHCDLQHGNVLLVPGSKAGSVAVKLVDYDGMCVPALTMLKSIEVGHPNFQHPQRAKDGIYSLDVDRFSHLVIYTAVRALQVSGRSLWDKYDNGDNLLFKASDFEAPHRSPLLAELLNSRDAGVRQLAETLKRSSAAPLAHTPLLSGVANGLAAPGNIPAGARSGPPTPAAAAGQTAAVTRSVPPPPVPVEPYAFADGSAAQSLPRARKRVTKSTLPPGRSRGPVLVLLAGGMALALFVLAAGGAGWFFLLRDRGKPDTVAQRNLEETPKAPAPRVEETPKVEPSPKVEETPKVEPPPTVEETPKVEPPPKSDSGEKKDPPPKVEVPEAVKPVPKPPQPAVQTEPTYLADLPEIDPVVGYGRFGKKGQMGYTTDNIDHPVTVLGKKYSNSLSMHAKDNGTASVKYRLDKTAKTFVTSVAVNDSAADRTVSPIVFQVLGDGKVLWKSRPVLRNGFVQDCRVDVTGVDLLTLRVDCDGRSTFALTVWLDPYILREVKIAAIDPKPEPEPGSNGPRALRLTEESYIEIANSEGLVDWNRPQTIEMWLRLPEPVARRGCQLVGENAGAAQRPSGAWSLGLSTGGPTERQPRWSFGLGYATQDAVIGASMPPKFPITPDTWHHVALVRKPPEFSLYVDGRLFWGRTTDKPLKVGNVPLHIGGVFINNIRHGLEGDIAGFRISNKARYQRAFIPKREFTKDADTVVLMEFSGKGTVLKDLVGDRDGRITNGKWMDEKGKPVEVVKTTDPKPDLPVVAAGVSPLDKLERNRMSPIFRRAYPPDVVAVANGAGEVTACAFTPDGSRLLTAEKDGTMRFWNMNASVPVSQGMIAGKVAIQQILFTPSGKRVLALDNENTLTSWDLMPEGASVRHASFKANAQSRAFAIHPDGVRVAAAVGSSGALLRLGDTDFTNQAVLQGAMTAYAFRPDGKMFASVFFQPKRNGEQYGSEVKLWDISGEQPVEHDVFQQTRSIKTIAWSPDGKLLATGSFDGQVRIWDLEKEPNEKAKFVLGPAPRVVSFTPDSAYLVAVSGTTDIALWNVAEGKKERSWKVESPITGTMSRNINLAVLAPDGRHLAFCMSSHQMVILRLPMRKK